MAERQSVRQTKPSSVTYFYGRITRDEAEIILTEQSLLEGMYLLRESISPLGNYAISVCHDSKVHHYVIEKQADGMYMIPQGKKFIGPVELIQHHTMQKDGIVTRLSMSCDRVGGQMPVAFRGMSYQDLENELLRKADSMRGVNMERALGPQRDHLVIMVAKDLHTKQPWYHGKINRPDSEKRLRDSGHKDGKFLVRLRDDKKTFALCISYEHDTRHYMIDKNQDSKYGIQDGPKFDCIMMLIDHYHNKQDGLLCKLTEPCPNPGFDKKQLKKYMDNSCENLQYLKVGQHKPTQGATANGRPPSLLPNLPPAPPIPGGHSQQPSPGFPPPVPSADRRPSLSELQRRGTRNKGDSRPLPPTPDEGIDQRLNGDWDEMPTGGFSSRNLTIRGLGVNPEELEDTYVSIPRTAAHFNLQRSQIDLQETLGTGQFGSVCKGTCLLKDGRKVPVAIKTLKKEDVSAGQEPELMTEARLMQPLSHKHIVRMIGLCKADCIMLVLELAPLGQLNTFLHEHKETPQATIVELLWQVAMGMEYLESKKFVHRDLAARNVLLVSEHFAKISDFGMSKALARDNNYYEAQTAGKWPLKWYAPECVFYWKFDSKSDVWSYGVTLWEATSYGDKPYKKMKGQEILRFLVDQERRLAKPENCDDGVYQVMLNCWEFDKHTRPTFKEIAAEMKIMYEKLKFSSRR